MRGPYSLHADVTSGRLDFILPVASLKSASEMRATHARLGSPKNSSTQSAGPTAPAVLLNGFDIDIIEYFGFVLPK
jgi:hypothetical protein